jgi:hypothetical protein
MKKSAMKKMHVPLALLLAGGSLLAAAADDSRQLATLPAAAEVSLREEMRANLVALNEVISLTGAGKLKDAADMAEKELGVSAMGKHRTKPVDARPGPHMPPAMHQLGMDGHKAASAFATIAARGEREAALAALPSLMNACIGCHHAYRIR